MQVRAVLGFVEHFSRFREDCGGEVVIDRFDRAVFSKKIRLRPVLPRFERLPVHFGRKANAKPLFDMQARDHHTRPAREIGAVFPERPIGGLIVLPDA